MGGFQQHCRGFVMNPITLPGDGDNPNMTLFARLR